VSTVLLCWQIAIGKRSRHASGPASAGELLGELALGSTKRYHPPPDHRAQRRESETLHPASRTAEISPHGRVPSPAMPTQAGSPRQLPAGVELETTPLVSASQCRSATCLPAGDVEMTTNGN
jgi:hypothetical protein